MTSILIIMNNYFHDLASAVLLGSAVIMYALGRQAEREGPAASAALAGFYTTLTKFAWGAVAWIVIGGVPRVIFFRTHEFIPAVEKGLLTALGLKHVLFFTAVVVGLVLWRSVKRKIEAAAASGVPRGGER